MLNVLRKTLRSSNDQDNKLSETIQDSLIKENNSNSIKSRETAENSIFGGIVITDHLNTVIYARVSSSKQNNYGRSIIDQMTIMSDLAKRFNLIIVEMITDTDSAYKKIPHNLQRVLNYKNKTIIFYAVDRFSRNYEEGKKNMEKLLKNDNIVIFYSGEIILKKNDESDDRKTENSAYSQFLRFLRAAQSESDNISCRIKDRKKIAKQGGFYSGGRVPFEMIKINDMNGRKRLIKDVNKINIVKFIKACRTPGTSINKINHLFERCGADTTDYPIELDDSSNILKDSLSYKNISKLLLEYNICNLSISKIRSIYLRTLRSNNVETLTDDEKYTEEELSMEEYRTGSTELSGEWDIEDSNKENSIEPEESSEDKKIEKLPPNNQIEEDISDKTLRSNKINKLNIATISIKTKEIPLNQSENNKDNQMQIDEDIYVMIENFSKLK